MLYYQFLIFVCQANQAIEREYLIDYKNYRRKHRNFRFVWPLFLIIRQMDPKYNDPTARTFQMFKYRNLKLC